MTSLFEQLVKERTYTKNSSPRTLEFRRASMKAYQKVIGSATDLHEKAMMGHLLKNTREFLNKTAMF